MKVGIVCYPTVGGSGIVATELGHELASRGHEVHFIAYEMPFRLDLQQSNIHFHPVEINQYELFKYPDYALTLAVTIASISLEYRLDVLHVHYAIPHATSAYLAKRLLKKHKPVVITTLHGTDITLVGKEAAYFQIVKFSIEESDGVTAVSKHLRDQTLRYFGVKKEIQVLYNFFTPDPRYHRKRQELKKHYVAEGEKLLLHSSNYRPVKRPEDVVKIFHQIRKKIPCKLMLLGSGFGIKGLRQYVNELGLSSEVIFIGENRLIDPYVVCADLFLLPSEEESFGLAALEALSYGVPVLASDAGGLPELIRHGKTGYLSAVGDIQGFANHALELLMDQEKYQKMAQAAKQDAKERFCAKKIVPQYELLYNQVCQEAL